MPDGVTVLAYFAALGVMCLCLRLAVLNADRDPTTTLFSLLVALAAAIAGVALAVSGRPVSYFFSP
jgi:hypothetical protein